MFARQQLFQTRAGQIAQAPSAQNLGGLSVAEGAKPCGFAHPPLNDGPIIEDYPEHAPEVTDFSGWACPINLAQAETDSLTMEIDRLATWYDRAVAAPRDDIRTVRDARRLRVKLGEDAFGEEALISSTDVARFRAVLPRLESEHIDQLRLTFGTLTAGGTNDRIDWRSF